MVFSGTASKKEHELEINPTGSPSVFIQYVVLFYGDLNT